MRNIRGLRLRTDGRWENDPIVQSVLDYESKEFRFVDGHVIMRSENGTIERPWYGNPVTLLRSRNRSTLPIAPYGVRPTTSFGYRPSRLPVSFTGIVKSLSGDRTLEVRNAPLSVLSPGLNFDYQGRIAPRILSKFRVLDSELGIVIAELGETLKMLKIAVDRVRAGLKVFKRGRFTDIKKEYERLSGKSWDTPNLGNLWLEFRYGWTPFFHDVESLLRDFNKIGKKVAALSRVSAGHQETVSVLNRVDLSPGYGFIVDLNVTMEARHRMGYFVLECDGFAKYTGGSMELITDPKVFVSSIFNPASTGWDLIPYSFVVDWFVSIGEYLRQQGTLYHNIKVIDGYSRRENRITNITADQSLYSIDGVFTPIVNEYERVKTLSLPYTNIELDLSFNSIKHLIDSIFLTTQRIKR